MSSSAPERAHAAASTGMVDVHKLSVKELRALIDRAGLSYRDCVEKIELIERAQSALVKLATSGHTAKPSSRPRGAAPTVSIHRKLSAYDCMIKGDKACIEQHEGARADMVAVILHGFGASNTDFSGFADAMMQYPALVGKRVVFVFPQAMPHAEAFGMPAWWKLDLMAWMAAAMSGQEGLAKLIRTKPDDIDVCREYMLSLVREARLLYGGGVSSAKTLLGGFSQGAMTAMDVSLCLPRDEAVGGTLMISGAPIVVDEWAQKLRDVHQGARVLLTHGRSDPTLPFMVSGWTHSLLKDNGASVEYEVHNGGHEVGPPEVMAKIAAFMGQLAALPHAD